MKYMSMPVRWTAPKQPLFNHPLKPRKFLKLSLGMSMNLLVHYVRNILKQTCEKGASRRRVISNGLRCFQIKQDKGEQIKLYKDINFAPIIFCNENNTDINNNYIPVTREILLCKKELIIYTGLKVHFVFLN